MVLVPVASRKRQAEGPLLPLRSLKQPRKMEDNHGTAASMSGSESIWETIASVCHRVINFSDKSGGAMPNGTPPSQSSASWSVNNSHPPLSRTPSPGRPHPQNLHVSALEIISHSEPPCTPMRPKELAGDGSSVLQKLVSADGLVYTPPKDFNTVSIPGVLPPLLEESTFTTPTTSERLSNLPPKQRRKSINKFPISPRSPPEVATDVEKSPSDLAPANTELLAPKHRQVNGFTKQDIVPTSQMKFTESIVHASKWRSLQVPAQNQFHDHGSSNASTSQMKLDSSSSLGSLEPALRSLDFDSGSDLGASLGSTQGQQSQFSSGRWNNEFNNSASSIPTTTPWASQVQATPSLTSRSICTPLSKPQHSTCTPADTQTQRIHTWNFLWGYSPKIDFETPYRMPTRKTDTKSKHKSAVRRQRNRPHIFQDAHRAGLASRHKEIRAEVADKLFQFRKSKGSTSSVSDFMSFLDYSLQLRHTVGEPSPSEQNLNDEAWLKNYVNQVTATFKKPPPKVYTPHIELLNHVVRSKDEALESRLHPPRLELPSSLPLEDEQMVNQFLRKRGVIAKFAREQVSDQDIRRLGPGQWLNDEIINFYGAMIMARADAGKGKEKAKMPGRQLLKAFYLSTFFWSKLTKEGYEKGRLGKWTKKVDIFTKDVVLIPVNHSNAHWTAAAINFKQRRFESYDSMGMAKEQVFKHLRSYVDAEHRNKRKAPFDFSGWQNWAPDHTPQQENGYDCGVFTCQFLQALSRGDEYFYFTQQDMPYLRRRMIWEIGSATLRDGV